MRVLSLRQGFLLCMLLLAQSGWAFERTDGVVVKCHAERNEKRRDLKEV